MGDKKRDMKEHGRKSLKQTDVPSRELSKWELDQVVGGAPKRPSSQPSFKPRPTAG
jgi:hypothetical protein